MVDTFTPNLNLVKPEVGASRDAWGGKWNTNADTLDAAIAGVKALIASIPPGVPAGVIADWASPLPAPSGWLKCNGATLYRVYYPALFTAIGGVYGAPDSATFSLPDIRGLFRRGLDEGRGVDPSRGYTGVQGSQNLSHTHGLTGGGAVVQLYGSGPLLYVPPYDSTNIALHAVDIAASGGGEARPINIAFPVIIKY